MPAPGPRFLDVLNHACAASRDIADWNVDRLDLDRHGRLSARLSILDSRGGMRFMGALRAGGVEQQGPSSETVMLFRVENDPRLNGRAPWSAVERGLDGHGLQLVECVAYRPLKRAVHRGLLRGSDGEVLPVFVKLRRRPASEVTVSLVARADLWAHRARRDLLPVDRGPTAECWHALTGVPLADLLENRTAVDEAMEHVGAACARLMVLPLSREEQDALPRRGWSEMASITRRHLDRWRRLFPSRAPSASATIPAAPPEPGSLVLAHGDLHEAQVFLEGVPGEHTARFIDPDALCLAPPEADIANLAAHLDLERIRRTGRPLLADPQRVDTLFDSLRLHAPRGVSLSRRRFDCFRELARVRLAAVYGLRPVEREVTPLLLEAGRPRSAPLRLLGRTVLTLAAVASLLAGTGGSAAAETVRGLRDGLWVEAKGDFDPGHGLEAAELELKDTAPHREPRLRGKISAIDTLRRELEVLGLRVHVPLDALLHREGGAEATFAAFIPGEGVKLSGLRTEGTRLVAREVEILDAESAAKDPRAEGFVTGARVSGEGWRFAILGLPVETDDATAMTVRPEAAHLVLSPLDVSISSAKRSDADWQPAGRAILGQDFRVGGRLSLRTSSERDRDLGLTGRDDRTLSNLHARLHGAWTPSPWLSIAAELRLEGGHLWRTPGGEESLENVTSELGPSFVLYRPRFAPYLAVQLGRIDLDEDREWFYDQNLDGIRLLLSTWEVEGHLALLRRDIAPSAMERDESYTVLRLARSGRPWLKPEVHVVRREDRRSDDDRTWWGMRLPLRTRNLRTWADMALARGDYRGNRVRTWALDVGAMVRRRHPARVSLFLGYGAASGDPDRADAIDREFRDTGISDNNDNVDGVKSFNYYGEFIRPELSNLRTWRVGAGFRPVRWASVDVVHHTYRQAELRDRFRSTLDDLEIRPDGVNRDLGRELNVVVGLRDRIPVEIELVWARFFPGAAFPDAQPGSLLKLEVEHKW